MRCALVSTDDSPPSRATERTIVCGNESTTHFLETGLTEQAPFAKGRKMVASDHRCDAVNRGISCETVSRYEQANEVLHLPGIFGR